MSDPSTGSLDPAGEIVGGASCHVPFHDRWRRYRAASSVGPTTRSHVYPNSYILPVTNNVGSDASGLPPHWFQILLSLADQDLHGLAITRDVFDRTDGRMHLWPGKLYGALKTMTDAGLISESAAPRGFEAGGGRPRFYRITALGRRACAAEASRLARFVEVARSKRLIKRPDTT